MQITIQNKIYNLKFGFGVVRRIVQHYGGNRNSDYAKIVKRLKIDKLTEDPNFEQLEFLGLLFIAAIRNAGEKIDISTDAMIDEIVQQPELFLQLQEEIQRGQVQDQKDSNKGGK